MSDAVERARNDLQSLARAALQVAQMEAELAQLNAVCARPSAEYGAAEFASEEDALRYIVRNRLQHEVWRFRESLRAQAIEAVDSGIPGGVWMPIEVSGRRVQVRLSLPHEDDDTQPGVEVRE